MVEDSNSQPYQQARGRKKSEIKDIVDELYENGV